MSKVVYLRTTLLIEELRLNFPLSELLPHTIERKSLNSKLFSSLFPIKSYDVISIVRYQEFTQFPSTPRVLLLQFRVDD